MRRTAMPRRIFINQVMACCIYPALLGQNIVMMNNMGIIIRESRYGVKETVDRIQSFLAEQGATIYARIDQAAETKKSGQHLLPLEFLLFGNPMAGGPLMAENPLIALDLPLKVIAWQDVKGKVWLAYNDGAYIESRYAIPHSPNAALYIDQLVDRTLR